MRGERTKISTIAGEILRQATALLIAFLLITPPLAAQQNQERREPTGNLDLAGQNFRRVAASAAEIERVLRSDSGLLVELKRWVAKEATDRGQLVDDAALSDSAVFARLQTDLEFRSVATRLVQRFGYLLPKINPDSEMAQEEKLVLEERVRLRAKAREREEEEQRARERQERQSDTLMERADNRESSRDRSYRNANREGRSSRPNQDRRGRDALQTTETLITPSPLDTPGSALPERSLRGQPDDESARRRPLLQAGATSDVAALNRATDGLGLTGDLDVGGTESRLRRAQEADRVMAQTENESGKEFGTNRRARLTTGSEEETEFSRAGLVRRPNPYSDIPSLYEMYSQAKSQPGELKRFGLDVFRSENVESDRLPMDLPAGPDYVVGPGDGLAINVWGSLSQRFQRTVDREGRLVLPEVGPVLVSGKTMSEVQLTVQRVLRTQFRDISADVSLSRLRTVRVYVVGDVEEPGAYDISSLSTPLNGLFAAGGPTTRGSLRLVKHYRGNKLVQQVDVYDLLLRGVRSGIERLQSGDSLLVPPLGAQIVVEGAVRRPARYELSGEKNLAEALDLAGGILPTATLRNIQVQRLEAHEKRTMLSLDIPEKSNDESVRKKLEAFEIRDGDEIRIFPIAAHNEDAIYLEGHVVRPGRYSYKPGMKVSDLVSSFGDLLPEPAGKYAEIVRLNKPDYRPTVESFSLEAVLANPAAAPVLQPQDTVRIFSRYDFENPPTVWLSGEVRQPGLYRTSGQVHLRDAVQLAGGTTPDAQMETAQVFRYQPDSKLKIFSINLGEALGGNPVDNILLQPRDRVVIHRNLAKADPPSVYVKGEIDKPGRYPLTTNMKISDLIRLSGGPKRSAYLETADLTRFLPDATMQRIGEHLEINIGAAVTGDEKQDLPLRDGDTLAIRQLPGWNDIGAAIVITGEVQHPGTYGIKPGERLSSVLKRVGGFLPTAYAEGAVLERVEVRQLQERSKQELINRIESESTTVKVAISTSGQEQAALQQAALQQRQRVLDGLKQAPITGRLVISLKSNLDQFEKSPDNIELRAGDRLHIPKRPNFVVVTGQVYNSNAITYTPRKNAGWYLRQAGGPTGLANKTAVFIVRANGSVVGGNRDGWWSGGVLSAPIFPGDTIVVPEKPIGGGTFWKSFLSVAQLAQSAAIAVAIVTR